MVEPTEQTHMFWYQWYNQTFMFLFSVFSKPLLFPFLPVSHFTQKLAYFWLYLSVCLVEESFMSARHPCYILVSVQGMYHSLDGLACMWICWRWGKINKYLYYLNWNLVCCFHLFTSIIDFIVFPSGINKIGLYLILVFGLVGSLIPSYVLLFIFYFNTLFSILMVGDS